MTHIATPMDVLPLIQFLQKYLGIEGEGIVQMDIHLRAGEPVTVKTEQYAMVNNGEPRLTDDLEKLKSEFKTYQLMKII